MLRIGIVVGEASGDLLAASLIAALQGQYPDAVFEGIAGPQMQALGAKSLYSMERLSVMGLFEVLGRYLELQRMRQNLIRHFIANPPDVFIGVDAPDFNLVIEAQLKAHGIKTVHYVSPSVWAWRQYRMRKIKRSVDLMLTLFPFEAKFYQQWDIPVQFVGHPLADTIPMQEDRDDAREILANIHKVDSNEEVLVMLPGSRISEVSRLAAIFIRTAENCLRRRPGLQILVPFVNKKTRILFEAIWRKNAPDLALVLIDGHSREVMAVADVVLLASGTAALEAMLLKKPMVVAYRLSALSYPLVRMLIKVDSVSLPNLLAGEIIVPELIQSQASPEYLTEAVLDYFIQPQRLEKLRSHYQVIHASLKQNASRSAARAILGLITANTINEA